MIGQRFEGTYPPEAAAWCNSNNAYIEEESKGVYVIKAVTPSAEQVAINKEKATQRQLEVIDLASIASLRTLALDLARGMTLPEAAEAARVKLQELEANAQALKGDGENADV